MMLMVVLLNALFASTFTFGKIALTHTTPFFFIGISMLIGGLLLLGYQFFMHRHKLTIRREDWRYVLQVSFFSIFISYGLQFWGLQYLPSFKACFLYNFGPFTSYLFAYFLFGEKMVPKKWIGMLLGFVGLLPVLLSTSPAEQAHQWSYFISWPEIAIIASAAAYAYGWFIIGILVHDKEYSALTVNGYSMVIGGVLALLTASWAEGPFMIKEYLPFSMALSAIILIEYIICNNLYAALLARFSETFLSFTTFLIPIFGAFYGWLFLTEAITWHFFASLFIVAIAIWLFYRAEMEENPTHTHLEHFTTFEAEPWDDQFLD